MSKSTRKAIANLVKIPNTKTARKAALARASLRSVKWVRLQIDEEFTPAPKLYGDLQGKDPDIIRDITKHSDSDEDKPTTGSRDAWRQVHRDRKVAQGMRKKEMEFLRASERAETLKMIYSGDRAVKEARDKPEEQDVDVFAHMGPVPGAFEAASESSQSSAGEQEIDEKPAKFSVSVSVKPSNPSVPTDAPQPEVTQPEPETKSIDATYELGSSGSELEIGPPDPQTLMSKSKFADSDTLRSQRRTGNALGSDLTKPPLYRSSEPTPMGSAPEPEGPAIQILPPTPQHPTLSPAVRGATLGAIPVHGTRTSSDGASLMAKKLMGGETRTRRTTIASASPDLESTHTPSGQARTSRRVSDAGSVNMGGSSSRRRSARRRGFTGYTPRGSRVAHPKEPSPLEQLDSEILNVTEELKQWLQQEGQETGTGTIGDLPVVPPKDTQKTGEQAIQLLREFQRSSIVEATDLPPDILHELLCVKLNEKDEDMPLKTSRKTPRTARSQDKSEIRPYDPDGKRKAQEVLATKKKLLVYGNWTLPEPYWHEFGTIAALRLGTSEEEEMARRRMNALRLQIEEDMLREREGQIKFIKKKHVESRVNKMINEMFQPQRRKRKPKKRAVQRQKSEIPESSSSESFSESESSESDKADSILVFEDDGANTPSIASEEETIGEKMERKKRQDKRFEKRMTYARDRMARAEIGVAFRDYLRNQNVPLPSFLNEIVTPERPKSTQQAPKKTTRRKATRHLPQPPQAPPANDVPRVWGEVLDGHDSDSSFSSLGARSEEDRQKDFE